jgi:hypothetical protein
MDDDIDMPTANRPWERLFKSAEVKINTNAGQRRAWQRIKGAIDADPNDPSVQRLFYLKGDGGTGKTFVYNSAIAYMRWKQKGVLPAVSLDRGSAQDYPPLYTLCYRPQRELLLCCLMVAAQHTRPSIFR